MNNHNISSLLKTIKNSHKTLLIACIISFILLLSISQRSVFDDALDELRVLNSLNDSNIMKDFLLDNPEAMNSQPILMDCFEKDSSMDYYLSNLCDVKVIGFEDTKCLNRLNYFLDIDFPENDSLIVWVNWLDFNNGGSWLRSDESRGIWSPQHPSEIADTLRLVGMGMSYYKMIPNFNPFGEDHYDRIFTYEYSFVPFDSSGWSNKDEVTLKYSLPAMKTFALFNPTDWIDNDKYRDRIKHQYGDNEELLGGIKSLGLQEEALTITGAINRVQQLRKPDRNIRVTGVNVTEPIATFLTPLVLLVLQINLLIHFNRLVQLYTKENIIELSEFPWIPFYPGLTGKLYAIITFYLFPLLLILWLTIIGLTETYDAVKITAITILGTISSGMGVVTIYQLLKFKKIIHSS